MKKFLVTYLAPPSVIDEWQKTDPSHRKQEEEKMMGEWKKWTADHKKIFDETGVGVGKPKRVTKQGTADARNDLMLYSIVEADSHAAAARTFEGHPHLQIPQSSIEVMELNPMRGKKRTMLQSFPMYAYIPAKDVARARQFYEGKLGFRVKEEIAGGIVYEFKDKTACFLYATPNAGTSLASQAFWQVDDVEREVSELKSRGVVFEDYDIPGEKSPSGVVTAGGAKAAWFKDTEGNILAIIERV